MENLIKYGIITFAVSLTLYFLNRGTKESQVKNDAGEYILKMNKLYFIVGCISWTIALVLLVMPLLIANIEASALIPIACMVILFGGLGTPCVLLKNHYVKFNETEIEVKNSLNKVNKVGWAEIASIKLNTTSGFITILNTNGTKIKIHQHIVGINTFLQKLYDKTQLTISQEAKS